MSIANEASPSSGVPPLTMATVGLMFIAGAVATTAFDFWGQVVSPRIGCANLSPHGLARSLLGRLGLPAGDFAGYFVHFSLVGLIGYPVGWLYVFQPAWRSVAGDRSGWLALSAIHGFGPVGLRHRRAAHFPELHRHHLGRPDRAYALGDRDGGDDAVVEPSVTAPSTAGGGRQRAAKSATPPGRHVRSPAAAERPFRMPAPRLRPGDGARAAVMIARHAQAYSRRFSPGRTAPGA